MSPIPPIADTHLFSTLAEESPNLLPAWQGTLAPTSVDLIAMLVSDSGLSSNEPQWWNSSVKGCILIGLQPRGGWQVMQRTVQWGDDHLTRVFGVTCSKPVVYAYFACSIRNRLEKWDSEAWISPTEGQTEGGKWRHIGRSNVDRPGKLIDGSRGGQAFICDLLLPPEGKPYPIVDQARMQFRSLLLVAAGLIKPDSLENLDEIMREDFQLSEQMGVIFRPVLVGLLIINFLAIGFGVTVFVSVFRRGIFPTILTPYIVQSISLVLWAVGAIGLLTLGGNPRVKIVESPRSKLPPHISSRLEELKEKADEEEIVQITFGSLHGSVYTADHGYCSLPFDVVHRICRWDVELVRTRGWKIAFIWWGFSLLFSIALQIVAAQVANVASSVFSVCVLLVTALARGYGVAGPEEWLIPRWKRRTTASYGARLVGKMESRTA